MSDGVRWGTVIVGVAAIGGGMAACVAEEWAAIDGDGDGSRMEYDCDDNDEHTYPGAAERDSADSCMTDVDGDGWGDSSAADGVVPGTDCDDRDAAMNQDDADGDGATSCAGDCDDGEPAQNLADADGDGWSSCAGDCLDEDADTYPGAAEYDSSLACMTDSDGDGWGDDDPAEGVDAGTDCDDADETRNHDDGDGDGETTCDGDCDDGDPWVGIACDLSLVTLPAGTFTMGSPPQEPGRDDDETQREVTLTRAFRFGQYEVTQAEFETYLGYNNSDHEECPDCPAENLSWNEAAAFANAVSESVGLTSCYECDGSDVSVACSPVGNPYECEGFRLPTEAEWEYAARGGLAEQAFPCGGGLQPGDTQDCGGDLVLDNGHGLDDEAWYCGNAGGETQPVGGLQANSYTLYDMSGNVGEWCYDRYSEWVAEGTDPVGPDPHGLPIVRGGRFNVRPEDLRVADRKAKLAGEVGPYGIRLARTVP